MPDLTLSVLYYNVVAAIQTNSLMRMLPVGQHNIRKYLFANLVIFFLVLLFLHIFVGYYIMKLIFIRGVHADLEAYTARVRSDFSFTDGLWNTSRYLADPLTPHPNGSSGYTQPLYIVTSNGFVLERSSPIHGFLDTSDFQKIRTFTTPQYVNGDTNERWRVLSKEIMYNNAAVGVILVASYNPTPESIPQVDFDLRNNIDILLQKISITADGSVSVQGVDVRNIQYSVSFEIVDVHNRVLLNNGRTPSFIDPSYVDTAARQQREYIRDEYSHEQFFVHYDVIRDNAGTSKGMIIAAHSLSDMDTLLRKFLIVSFLFGVGVVVPISLLFSQIIRDWMRMNIAHERDEALKILRELPASLSFDRKKPAIIADEILYPIAYASNQYYVCDALFSQPKKRWETDILLDRMGEKADSKNSRTLYDTVLALNKKFLWRLVVYKDKTYQLNPDLLSRLSS